MDGVSLPTSSYLPTVLPPHGNAAPTPPAVSAQSGAAVCVSDFVGGVTGAFVLEWREPQTNQVIAELPMVTALAPFPGTTGAASQIGRYLDTTV
jgi:hypothetical protein